MDSWNTIVSRCFSFSLGYVSFLEGGEWWGTFFGGATEDQEWNFWEPTYVPFQQSWHKWIMVSLTMTVVSCRKSALSFSKPRSSGGFSVESYPSMSSQFFCIRIFVLLDTTLFFFMSSFQRVHLRTKSLQAYNLDPRIVEKNGAERSFLPSQRSTQVLFVISFTSLVLLFKVSDFRCVHFFWVGKKKWFLRHSTNLLFVVDDLLSWLPWFVSFHWCFFGSTTCRMQK